MIPISSVFASGLDSGDNVTEEEHDSYVDGYDAGFAEIMTAIELANVMKKEMMSIMNLGLTLDNGTSVIINKLFRTHIRGLIGST